MAIFPVLTNYGGILLSIFNAIKDRREQSAASYYQEDEGQSANLPSTTAGIPLLGSAKKFNGGIIDLRDRIRWRGQRIHGLTNGTWGVNCLGTVARMIKEYRRGHIQDEYRLPQNAFTNGQVMRTGSVPKSRGRLSINPQMVSTVQRQIDQYLERGLPVGALVSVVGKRTGPGTDHWVLIVGRSDQGAKARYHFYDPGALTEKGGGSGEFILGEGGIIKKGRHNGRVPDSAYQLYGIQLYEKSNSNNVADNSLY